MTIIRCLGQVTTSSPLCHGSVNVSGSNRLEHHDRNQTPGPALIACARGILSNDLLPQSRSLEALGRPRQHCPKLATLLNLYPPILQQVQVPRWVADRATGRGNENQLRLGTDVAQGPGVLQTCPPTSRRKQQNRTALD